MSQVTQLFHSLIASRVAVSHSSTDQQHSAGQTSTAPPASHLPRPCQQGPEPKPKDWPAKTVCRWEYQLDYVLLKKHRYKISPFFFKQKWIEGWEELVLQSHHILPVVGLTPSTTDMCAFPASLQVRLCTTFMQPHQKSFSQSTT